MKTVYLFILIIFGSFGTVRADNKVDSIGIRWVDGKPFIMHKVERGEGLFAIARRYNYPVDEIRKANPTIGDNLALGQIVLVPTKRPSEEPKKEEPKKEEPKKEEPKKEEPKKEQTGNEESVVHTVKPGETLYAISRIYQVSVEDIRSRNNLKSDNLSAGQQLQIKGKSKPSHEENYGGGERPKEPSPKEPAPIVQPRNTDSYEYNPATGEVKEVGHAVVALNESLNHDRSFCLHPTAPNGSIIMVTNTGNNKSVFVRVVGKPINNEDKVVIKLSKSAALRIGLDENDRAVVRLNYAR